MNTVRSKRMADLDFLLVPSFLHYVEMSAGLTEVSTHAIFSFSVASYGVGSLLKRKQKLLGVLLKNNRKLSEWSSKASYSHDSPEMVIIRSLYMTTRGSIDMVRGHVKTAERLLEVLEAEVKMEFEGEGVTVDELPF